MNVFHPIVDILKDIIYKLYRTLNLIRNLDHSWEATMGTPEGSNRGAEMSAVFQEGGVHREFVSRIIPDFGFERDLRGIEQHFELVLYCRPISIGEMERGLVISRIAGLGDQAQMIGTERPFVAVNLDNSLGFSDIENVLAILRKVIEEGCSPDVIRLALGFQARVRMSGEDIYRAVLLRESLEPFLIGTARAKDQ